MTKQIKLEVGKQYVLNNGEVHTCEQGETSGFKMGTCWYHEDGRCGVYNPDYHISVSHEYTLQEGTLAELGVKEGDVVEFLDWRNANYSELIGRLMIGRSDGGVSFDDGNYTDGFGLGATHIFRLISRASETPTLWRDMTPEEKGALLLADHEGEGVEYWDGQWRDLYGGFYSGGSYRIKPTPKVETMALCWRHDVENVKNKIGTIDLVDGKPDTASIKPDPTT